MFENNKKRGKVGNPKLRRSAYPKTLNTGAKCGRSNRSTPNFGNKGHQVGNHKSGKRGRSNRSTPNFGKRGHQVGNHKSGKRGQVTIFVIIAVVIVLAVIGYIFISSGTETESLPKEIMPVYKSYLSCMNLDLETGINILESRGGYIEMPDFESGSQHMPFSSQLEFMNNPVPYWYYVSGNGIEKTQVPSRSEMEKQLENYLENQARECEFQEYYQQGYEIDMENPEVEVRIKDNNVETVIDMSLIINKGETTSRIREHKIEVDSKLGELYEEAKNIYEYQQEKLFLEEYAIDTIRSYAPVDGVELTCAPKIWNSEEIFDELENAIEANTLALKTKAGNYELKEQNKYFVLDLKTNKNVRFINSKQWPSSYEIAPSEGQLLKSEPIGNQPGLGVLGFCYTPYHFVYNAKYPVLIQISSGEIINGKEEIFQFPMAVIVQGNKPREPQKVDALDIQTPEICEYKNTQMTINAYDKELNPIENFNVSFKCFGDYCDIKRKNLDLEENFVGEFPQCANGFIEVEADGYRDGRKKVSTVNSGNIGIVLDRIYEKEVEIKLDAKELGRGYAVITFRNNDTSKTLIYPQQKTIELSEGQYTIGAKVYENSSIRLQGKDMEKCVDVPKSGLSGLFGATEKECYQVEIPERMVSNVLSGGGEIEYYILESELKNTEILEINGEKLPSVKSVEDLQENYILFEDNTLNLRFK